MLALLAITAMWGLTFTAVQRALDDPSLILAGILLAQIPSRRPAS